MKQSPTHSPVRTLYGVSRVLTQQRRRHEPLVDVGDDFDGCFDAVFLHGTFLDGSDVVLAREAKDVECVLTGEANQLRILRPVYLNAKSVVVLLG